MRQCLACGYAGLEEPLWDGDEDSHQICPCCGLHYGYDDEARGRGDAGSDFYVGWRARWIMDGCPWFSTATPPPADWTGKESGQEQVRRAFGP